MTGPRKPPETIAPVHELTPSGPAPPPVEQAWTADARGATAPDQQYPTVEAAEAPSAAEWIPAEPPAVDIQPATIALEQSLSAVAPAPPPTDTPWRQDEPGTLAAVHELTPAGPAPAFEDAGWLQSGAPATIAPDMSSSYPAEVALTEVAVEQQRPPSPAAVPYVDPGSSAFAKRLVQTLVDAGFMQPR